MKVPQHVAIIMDGNRRWARQRGLPVVMGHKKVVEQNIEEIIERAGELGVKYLTLWAFSTENWQREQSEVEGIMRLFRWAFDHKAQRLADKGARLRVVGDIDRFDEDIRKKINYWIEKTKHNAAITVIFALNYGGRDELLRAVRKIQHSDTSQIVTEEIFATYLDTAGIPDPDLIIRPGGEKRLSGFMLWQSEYAELYFTDVLMPDFGAKELDLAVEEYAKRERRRGR